MIEKSIILLKFDVISELRIKIETTNATADVRGSTKLFCLTPESNRSYDNSWRLYYVNMFWYYSQNKLSFSRSHQHKVSMRNLLINISISVQYGDLCKSAFCYFKVGLIFKYLHKSVYSCDLLYSHRAIWKLICHFNIVRQYLYIVRHLLRSGLYFILNCIEEWSESEGWCMKTGAPFTWRKCKAREAALSQLLASRVLKLK